MRRLPPVTIFKECTWMQVQTNKSTKSAAEIRCKIGLVVFLLLGIALIAAGLWGVNTYNASGFDQEAAFGYIQKLSPQLDSLYETGIQPMLDALHAPEKAAVEQQSHALLQDAWTSAAKEDRAGKLAAYLEDSADPQRDTMELLAATYSVAGPKVSSKEKKALAAFTDAERTAFRQQVLLAVADETAPLPELAVASVEGEEGLERAGILMQLFLTSANKENEPLKSDDVNGLKKAARSADARITAYGMIAGSDIGFA